MKKVLRKHFLSLVVAMALTCALAVQPMAVFSAEVSVENKISAAEDAVTQLAENSQNGNTEGTSVVQPRSHVSYYPSSGPSSGVFYGATSFYPATYSYLPSGTMYFSYCVSGGGTCYLRFYEGNATGGLAIYSAPLTADDYAHESSINLPSSGSYTIEVYVPSGNASTERVYAFNLYRK